MTRIKDSGRQRLEEAQLRQAPWVSRSVRLGIVWGSAFPTVASLAGVGDGQANRCDQRLNDLPRNGMARRKWPGHAMAVCNGNTVLQLWITIEVVVGPGSAIMLDATPKGRRCGWGLSSSWSSADQHHRPSSLPPAVKWLRMVLMTPCRSVGCSVLGRTSQR